MAKKDKKAGLPISGLVYAGLACLFFGGAGSGYLWNKNQIISLGQDIRKYEMRLEEARRQRLFLDRTYAEMTSQAGLEDRVRRTRPDLAQAQVDQLVRVPEVAPSAAEKVVAQRAAGEERH